MVRVFPLVTMSRAGTNIYCVMGTITACGCWTSCGEWVKVNISSVLVGVAVGLVIFNCTTGGRRLTHLRKRSMTTQQELPESNKEVEWNLGSWKRESKRVQSLGPRITRRMEAGGSRGTSYRDCTKPNSRRVVAYKRSRSPPTYTAPYS